MSDIDKLLQEKILNAKTEEERQDVICEVKARYRDEQLKPLTLGMLFEIYAGMNPIENDDQSWFSAEIEILELKNIHPSFQTTNGCQWARSDNSYLGKKYIIKREHKNNRVFSVKLDGANDNSIKRSRGIRQDIIDVISKKRCAILDVGTNIEVDHKNGKYEVIKNLSIETQKESDFQPLSKAANDAKRAHCKACIKSGKRYNAKKLGYSQGYILGDENTKSCSGCYWYDPQYFNKIISKDYEKTK